MTILDKATFGTLLSVAFLGPLLLSPWGYDHAILIKESFLLLTSGLLLLLLLLRSTAARRLPLTWSELPLGKPILLLVACAAISLLRAVNLYAGLHRIALVMSGVSLYLVASAIRLGSEHIRMLAKAAVASAAVATLYAFGQYLGLDPLPRSTVGITSTLGNPNFLAEYLIVALPICFGLTLSSRSLGYARFYGLVAMLLFAGLLTTKAKGATLGFLVSMGLFFLLLRRQQTANGRDTLASLFPIALLAILVAMVFGVAFFSRFSGPGGVSAILQRYVASQVPYFKWRLIFYKDSVRLALDNTLMGVGIGNFESVYPRYRTMPETLDPVHNVLDHAHNDYLEIWAELGLGGLIAVVWLLWVFFAQIIRSQRAPVLAFGYAASVAALGTNSLFGFGLYNPVPLAAFWLCMALALRPNGSAIGGEADALGVLANQRPPLWALLLTIPATGVLLYASARPLVADAYLSRGHTLLLRGQASQAIRSLEQAARLAPARVEAQGYLARAYFEAGRRPEAIRVLVRYLSHDPDNFRMNDLLALYLERQGDAEAALQVYERVRRIYPFESRPLFRIGVVRERLGDVEGAMAAYREALRVNGTLAEASNNLAILLWGQGKDDEALQVWEEGARRNPDDLVVAENLARAYSTKGENEKALSFQDRAARLRAKGGIRQAQESPRDSRARGIPKD